MQLILLPPILYYTISINFILSLLKSTLKGFNYVALIIYKFAKETIIVLGYSN